MELETKSENAGQEANNKEEAFTHLAQGKRHLLVKDYNEAVTSLASACQLLSQLFGEIANECGEAYFNYGIALLELARTENGVLGIEGEGEESQDSDGEDEGDDEKESATESEVKHVGNGKGNENEAEENKEKNTRETESGNENEEEENKEKNTRETESKNVDETNGTKGTGDEEKDKSIEGDGGDDDVSNLHLAWQMLELAKVIFRRQAEGNKQMNLKLAEVYLKLGEVGLESENYSQAIEDIKTCLEIQTQHLDKHDRCIAETHYQLGIAYSLVNDFKEAIVQLTQARHLLEKRVEYLRERSKQGVSNAEQNENNPFYTIEGEISEINSLLPEVEEKISDMEDFKKEMLKALMARLDAKKGNGDSSVSGQGTSACSSGAFPVSSWPESDAKPVSDISHLVRKKRKLEPDTTEEKCSKQPCPEVSKLE